jgi:hypothetical protein
MLTPCALLDWPVLVRRVCVIGSPEPVSTEAMSLGFTSQRGNKLMSHVSGQINQRAVVVAVAGAVIGLLAQASLIDSIRSSKPPAAHHQAKSYYAGDAGRSCAAAHGFGQGCRAGALNLSLASADRESGTNPD